MTARSRQELYGYIAAVFCSACVYRALINFHAWHIDDITNSAQAVIDGRADFLAWQNRLLGPYLILLISKLQIPFLTAWKILTAFLISLESVLLFHILRRERQTIAQSILYIVVFWFAFLVLHVQLYYVWDQIDIVIFTIFIFGILQAKPAIFFLPLFLIAILNRESALFIALFVLLKAFTVSVKPFALRLTSTANLLLGSALLAGGILYTSYIRHALFVDAPGEGNPLLRNHVYLSANLRRLFVDNLLSIEVILSIAICSIVLFLLRRLASFKDPEIKATAIVIAMIVNTLIFGWLNETRLYFSLIPFVLLLWIRAAQA